MDDLVAGVRPGSRERPRRRRSTSTAPNPATNEQFTKALGSALHRPTVLPVPAFAARALFGEMGEAMLLGGQRVLPARLVEAGFDFSAPTLEIGMSAP